MSGFPPVLGISGYATSGKDTVAGILHDLYGYEQISFAKALRDCVAVLNPLVAGAVPGRDVRVSEMLDTYGYEETKSRSLEYRRLLQVMGTEVGREILGADIWVDTAFSRAPEGKLLVVSDVRFPNEFESIKARGGQVWRIERKGVTAVNAHVSETALDGFGFDHILFNYGSIRDLASKVMSVMDGQRPVPAGPGSEPVIGDRDYLLRRSFLRGRWNDK